MRKIIQNHLLVLLGWFFVLLGAVGVVLPLLPTTPFLILALALFSKSSPRFHQMLLDNAWFGPGLKQWEQNKSMSRRTKYMASIVIVITFALSIALLANMIEHQLLLLSLAIVLLFFMWRIKEEPMVRKTEQQDKGK